MIPKYNKAAFDIMSEAENKLVAIKDESSGRVTQDSLPGFNRPINS